MLLQELRDFDESSASAMHLFPVNLAFVFLNFESQFRYSATPKPGVERAPLTRVTLEATFHRML